MVRGYADKSIQGFPEFWILVSLLNLLSKILPFFAIGKTFHIRLFFKTIFKVNYSCIGSGAPSSRIGSASGRGEVRIWAW
jgi:hypothetical protein